LINDLKLCDPAVGSGHFLVSALNEIITIKSELNILQDFNGTRLKAYTIGVVNDELIITDEDNDIFTYNPKSPHSQLLQQTLFIEKQTIIENCLFGVDINPNSVKICRLRLWIELLKNAYYKPDGNLETLPNIDINIKCGNSLLSRFALDADLSKALKSIKYDVNAYRGFVNDYKNCKDRELKRGLQLIIDSIKADFRTEISKNDPILIKLNKASNELYTLLTQVKLFEDDKIKKANQQKQEKLEADINKWTAEIDEIKNNAIYKNAFEWRFEFPEVLNNNGDFEGFDVIVGNPPYIFTRDVDFAPQFKIYIEEKYFSLLASHEKKSKANQSGKINLFALFILRGLSLCRNKASLNYIVPNNLLRSTTYDLIRKFLLENSKIDEIVDLKSGVFDNVTASTVIFRISNNAITSTDKIKIITDVTDFERNQYKVSLIAQTQFLKNVSYTFNFFADETANELLNKIAKGKNKLGIYCVDIIEGIVAHKHLISESEHENSFPLLLGKSIRKYGLNPIIKFITWNTKEIHRTRPDYLWNSPKKIIIQRISGGSSPLTATIDQDQYKTFASVNNLLLKEQYEQYYEFIVALINSKMINWFYANSFSNNSQLTVNISKTYLEMLPIVTVTESQLNVFTAIVNEILVSKAKGENTIGLEQQIDALVYQLYDLTPDEIAIVENSVNAKNKEPESQL